MKSSVMIGSSFFMQLTNLESRLFAGMARYKFQLRFLG